MIFQGDNLAGDLGARLTQITADPPEVPNDDFDHATVISSLPFTITQDVARASRAPDDPVFSIHISRCGLLSRPPGTWNSRPIPSAAVTAPSWPLTRERAERLPDRLR